MALHREIDLAPFIDHALLNPFADQAYLEQRCEEADRFNFATVCIYPAHVKQVQQLLHGKRPKICVVIGFPSGATTSAVKLYESLEAVDQGAEELDVVINLGWLRAGQVDDLHRELAEICEETDKPVKAILEMSLLTEAEKRLAAEICMDAGVAFLKTSTGWSGGATVEDVRLLKQLTQDRVGIKASGGIRTAEQALELILAGATRLGTSKGPDLLRERDTLEEAKSSTSLP